MDRNTVVPALNAEAMAGGPPAQHSDDKAEAKPSTKAQIAGLLLEYGADAATPSHNG